MTTSIKTCKQCGEDKPLSEYYKHKAMKDEHLNKCKSCVKTRVKNYRNNHLDRIRAYDRERGSRQSAEDIREYRKRNPKKYKAHCTLNNAIRAGEIKKHYTCEECGSDRHVVGHHDDYNLPLSVRWLCQVCHIAWHIENGEGLNGS